MASRRARSSWHFIGGALLCLLTASPALADRCDDLAASLKGQVDGLTVGRTAANVIFLEHPAAAQLRLGCSNRSVTNELYAASETPKPKPGFAELVANTAALVFTIPKSDTQRGVARCLGRPGLLRGNDIRMRFRRLDFRCTRSKTGATIAISRERDG